MRGLIIFALLASARGCVVSLLRGPCIVRAFLTRAPFPAFDLPTPRSLLCGTGDPMFMQDVEPTTVPQEYHDSPQRNLACVGSACGQSYGSTYMTVKAANASSLTRPIRIKALWDVIKSGDTPCITLGSGCDPNPSLSCTSQTASCPYMCRSQSAANYYQVSSPAGTYASCESSDIVVQEGNAIYNAMVSRTNQAIQFWQSAGASQSHFSARAANTAPTH